MGQGSLSDLHRLLSLSIRIPTSTAILVTSMNTSTLVLPSILSSKKALIILIPLIRPSSVRLQAVTESPLVLKYLATQETLNCESK